MPLREKLRKVRKTLTQAQINKDLKTKLVYENLLATLRCCKNEKKDLLKEGPFFILTLETVVKPTQSPLVLLTKALRI